MDWSIFELELQKLNWGPRYERDILNTVDPCIFTFICLDRTSWSFEITWDSIWEIEKNFINMVKWHKIGASKLKVLEIPFQDTVSKTHFNPNGSRIRWIRTINNTTTVSGTVKTRTYKLSDMGSLGIIMMKQPVRY